MSNTEGSKYQQLQDGLADVEKGAQKLPPLGGKMKQTKTQADLMETVDPDGAAKDLFDVNTVSGLVLGNGNKSGVVQKRPLNKYFPITDWLMVKPQPLFSGSSTKVFINKYGHMAASQSGPFQTDVKTPSPLPEGQFDIQADFAGKCGETVQIEVGGEIISFENPNIAKDVYTSSSFLNDIQAGLTTSVILVPQAIAYATLAGLDPEYGLYCAFIPIFIYTLMGTSKQMSIGPFALVSMLVGDLVTTAIGAHAEDKAAYSSAVLLLTIMTGAVQIAMGLAGLGIVVSFLADSVVSGFITASAILIMTSQMKSVLGLNIEKGSFPLTIWEIIFNIGDTNFTAVLVTVVSYLALKYIKDISKKKCPKIPVPEQLIVVVVMTVLSWALKMDQQIGGECKILCNGLKVVEYIPPGLPEFTIPTQHHTEFLGDLVPASLVVALLSYMISISIVKTFSQKYQYTIDPNQEFLALGCANVCGSFFKSYPASGSLSRSAVCAAAGGKSPMHNIFQFFTVGLVLLFFTELFYYLPYAVLAAIILSALKSMLAFEEMWRLKEVSPTGDFVLWIISFVATLFLGVAMGIGIGMVTSMGLILMQTSRPTWARLGRLKDTAIYRNIKRFAIAEEVAGIVIFRFDAPLNFSNKEYFIDTLAQVKHQAATDHPDTPLLYVILDCSCMTAVDTSAILALGDLLNDHQRLNLTTLWATCRGPLRDAFKRSGFLGEGGKIKEANMYLELHDAVVFAEGQMKGMKEDDSLDSPIAVLNNQRPVEMFLSVVSRKRTMAI